MKAVTAFAVLFLVALVGQARAQVYDWVAGTNGLSEYDSLVAYDMDAEGNVYVFGNLRYDFYATGMESIAGTDTLSDKTGAYLAKYSPQGVLLSLIHIVKGGCVAVAMKVDRNGDLYFCGTFSGEITIGTVMMPGVGDRQCFLAKWNEVSGVQWTTTYSGTLYLYPQKMELDGAGNVYLSANYYGAMDFGSYQTTPLPGTPFDGIHGIYIVKYSANGAFDWAAYSNSESGYNTLIDMAVDPLGNVYVVGDAVGPGDFRMYGSQMTQAANITLKRMYIAMFDADGQVRGTDGSEKSDPVALACDSDGTCYLLASMNYDNKDAFKNTTVQLAPSNGHHYIAKLTFAAGVTSFIPIEYRGDLQLHGFAADADGNYYIVGWFEDVVTFKSGVLISSVIGWWESAFIARIDNEGNCSYALTAHADVHAKGMHVMVGTDGRPVIQGLFSRRCYFNGLKLDHPGFDIFFPSAFFAKVDHNVSNVTGRVYADFNANSMLDPDTEWGVAHVCVTGSDQSGRQRNYVLTDDSGRYVLALPMGTNTIRIQDRPYFHSLPPEHVVTFTDSGMFKHGLDFALQPSGDVKDLGVTLTMVNTASVGREFACSIACKNVGTVPIPSASVTLHYDTTFFFVKGRSVPTELSNSVPSAIVTWRVVNLQPQTERRISNIVFAVPPGTPWPVFADFKVTIEPLSDDPTPENNVDSQSVMVVASFDPNAIEVRPARDFLVAEAVGGIWLDYTIRFENTGNDFAHNISIENPLSELFDIATLKFVTASHDCRMSLQDSMTVVWNFYNIELPVAKYQGPLGNGFVRYRIKTKPYLPVGTRIENFADIYFDYGYPVRTNTVVTNIVDQLGVYPVAQTMHLESAYPNPTSGVATLRFTLDQPEVVRIVITDALGRVVKTQERGYTASGEQAIPVDLSSLPKGVYRAVVQTRSKSVTIPLVTR